MSGTLFGVGVGPGDPELVTMKAHRLIRTAEVVAYPALPGKDSFARQIAGDIVRPGTREIRIEVPMCADRAPAQAAYDHGAADIAHELAKGTDVVVLCEGDPLFYGSFIYLLARLKDRFSVEIVPGINSVSAAAAMAALPLAARNDGLSVLPGTISTADLRARIAMADAVAILKVGHRLPRIRAVIADLGLTEHAHYFERIGLTNACATRLADAPATAPYFSLILVTKGADPWL